MLLLNILSFSILLICSMPPLAHADRREKDLSALIAEYESISTEGFDEQQVEMLISNPLLRGLQFNGDESPSDLNQIAKSKAELAVLQRQVLLGQIFRQAVLEISETQRLSQLLLHGQGTSVPSAHRLIGFKALYELVYLLEQRTGLDSQHLLLELLSQKGTRYPSTDNLSRGFVHYMAQISSDRRQFAKALTLYEKLFALKSELKNRRVEESMIYTLSTRSPRRWQIRTTIRKWTTVTVAV